MLQFLAIWQFGQGKGIVIQRQDPILFAVKLSPDLLEQVERFERGPLGHFTLRDTYFRRELRSVIPGTWIRKYGASVGYNFLLAVLLSDRTTQADM